MKLASLVFFLSSPVFAQSAAADWIPLHTGDKWTYQHETRDDTGEGSGRLEIHRWQTEETIIGSWPVPEGTLIGRRARVVDGFPQTHRVDADPAFLIRGDCIYKLSTRDWEPTVHQLTPDFLKWLNAGEISPDFCFPLVVHKTWGAQPEATDWKVAGDQHNTIHITSASSYLGSGMTADIWFEKGVGVVREEEIHHGTIGEERTRLLRFQSAPEH